MIEWAGNQCPEWVQYERPPGKESYLILDSQDDISWHLPLLMQFGLQGVSQEYLPEHVRCMSPAALISERKQRIMRHCWRTEPQFREYNDRGELIAEASAEASAS